MVEGLDRATGLTDGDMAAVTISAVASRTVGRYVKGTGHKWKYAPDKWKYAPDKCERLRSKGSKWWNPKIHWIQVVESMSSCQ